MFVYAFSVKNFASALQTIDEPADTVIKGDVYSFNPRTPLENIDLWVHIVRVSISEGLL